MYIPSMFPGHLCSITVLKPSDISFFEPNFHLKYFVIAVSINRTLIKFTFCCLIMLSKISLSVISEFMWLTMPFSSNNNCLFLVLYYINLSVWQRQTCCLWEIQNNIIQMHIIINQILPDISKLLLDIVNAWQLIITIHLLIVTY